MNYAAMNTAVPIPLRDPVLHSLGFIGSRVGILDPKVIVRKALSCVQSFDPHSATEGGALGLEHCVPRR